MNKEYKILDVQMDGLFFPNNDEVAYSDMKRVYKNKLNNEAPINIPSKRLFTVEDDVYGGDKLIISGKKHTITFFHDGEFEIYRW